MKTPVAVIARFSGIVSYLDDTFQQFAGHLDEEGNLSLNYGQESNDAIYQVQHDESWLHDMLAQLGGHITLTANDPGTDKTVTGLVAEFSGRVAYDNGSSGDFIVQYNTQLGAIVPIGGDTSHWIAAVNNSATLAALTSLFAEVTGTSPAITLSISISPSPSAHSPSPSPSAHSPSVSRFSPSISAKSPSPSISAFSPSISTFSPSISTFSPSISAKSPSPSISAKSPSPSPSRSISTFSPSPSISAHSPSVSRRSPSLSPSPSAHSPSPSGSFFSPSKSPSPSPSA